MCRQWSTVVVAHAQRAAHPSGHATVTCIPQKAHTGDAGPANTFLRLGGSTARMVLPWELARQRRPRRFSSTPAVSLWAGPLLAPRRKRVSTLRRQGGTPSKRATLLQELPCQATARQIPSRRRHPTRRHRACKSDARATTSLKPGELPPQRKRPGAS